MRYDLDIERLSLDEYKAILKKQDILPSRRILLENIDENFSWFKSQGRENVAQLKKSISSSRKITALATESGISKDYLTILKRELGSLTPTPVPLYKAELSLKDMRYYIDFARLLDTYR